MLPRPGKSGCGPGSEGQRLSDVRVWRSYLVCGVQRTGSWLPCHALQDTGVLGVPAEYFHRGDEQFWTDRRGAADEDSFLRAVQTQPVTANGVWLRREDKLRQAISWWRAAATGEYALTPGNSPVPPPAFDRDAIERLIRYAEWCDDGWRRWFPAHQIQPLEIEHEDLVTDPDEAMRDVATFLDIAVPSGLGRVRPRMLRQADHHTEHFVELFKSLR
jgi:LPS sulfotransferase NodH